MARMLSAYWPGSSRDAGKLKRPLSSVAHADGDGRADLLGADHDAFHGAFLVGRDRAGQRRRRLALRLRRAGPDHERNRAEAKRGDQSRSENSDSLHVICSFDGRRLCVWSAGRMLS